MTNITEIIPDDFPEWAKDAMDNGQLFNVMCEKAKQLEAANQRNNLLVLAVKSSVNFIEHIAADENTSEEMLFKYVVWKEAFELYGIADHLK